MLDVRMLKEKQKFKEILDSYVIFITENDVIGSGMPMYHIERKIEETGESFNDGSHIIYVNGNYRGDDPVGKLVHDFRSRNSNDMFYSELSDSVKHFKEIAVDSNFTSFVESLHRTYQPFHFVKRG
jgi:hypothetical protein